MSDHIPFEIQTEIIKRLHPVKSLLRFRSVSKQWKSFIDGSEFITHHLLNNNTQHHLLIRYMLDSGIKYVSIVDGDHSLPQHKFYPVPPIANAKMLGSSHGLVCLFGSAPEPPNKLFYVWNPSIRKCVRIVSPIDTYIAGFGVCPNTSDPKIVAIKHGLKAEVFTLSTRAWRSVPMNMVSSSVAFSGNPVVVIDGAIHWRGYERNPNVNFNERIIKFDLVSEEFGEVALPDGLVDVSSWDISRFKESLAVMGYREDDAGKIVCDVWVMLKNGVSNSSFTKLFTVKNNSLCYIGVIGFRKNGQPIVVPSDEYLSLESELQVYEPSSEQMNGIGIYSLLVDMVNYTESLLLLNHSDSIIQ
ncbi:F-box/kelch-repeat protein At3g23880-like [Bidens hawaiensis]|uniref:F-box/kelch-repeat protein At3g23880-like n=1 Tax=Bidens hawaiensis TaxID=980011 RepID=UPI00404AD5CD